MIAHVCTSTGWTWDYCLWQLDIPRLGALSAQWRRLPPPTLQLARIALALGLSPADPVPVAPPPEDMAAALEMFPTAPLPEVMKPEEYLRRKAQQLEATHGQH